MQSLPRLSQAISRVLKSGQRSFGRFVCFSFLRGSPGFIRVIVSTKVSKKATVRNRLKRVVREYLRDKIAPDLQLMITFKKGGEIPAADELRQDLEGCLKKLMA